MSAYDIETELSRPLVMCILCRILIRFISVLDVFLTTILCIPKGKSINDVDKQVGGGGYLNVNDTL